MKMKIWVIAVMSILFLNTLSADSLEDLRKTCSGGNGEACYKAGDLLSESKIQEEQLEALDFWKKGCKLNFGKGCFEVGNTYLSAALMLKEENKQKKEFLIIAEDYYKKGGNLEHGASLFQYGLFLEEGLSQKTDKASAMKSFIASCQNNYGDACYKLALKNYRGIGIKQNYRDAINYAKKACDLKVEPGCYLSGNMSDAGKGTRGDPVEALRFYSKACKLGGARG
jgi:TPR repeat protein